MKNINENRIENEVEVQVRTENNAVTEYAARVAELVKKTVGYEGEIIWNKDMPDGTPRKLCDVTKLHNLGFTHKVELEEGVKLAYEWFKENVDSARL